jgi:hypothetical protein
MKFRPIASSAFALLVAGLPVMALADTPALGCRCRRVS